MPTTAKWGLRYPALSAAPNVPTDIGNLAGDLETQLSVPMVHLVQQTAQTGWTSATSTPVTFGAGSEVVDSAGMHDTSSNTSRIVIGGRLGWWQVSGIYAPATNSNATYLRSSIGFNGALVAGSTGGILVGSAAGFLAVPSGTVLVQATSASDYVELLGYQIAVSGTIGTGVSAPLIVSSLTATWLRPA